ncbi:MAG: glycosyltransferase family 39 protein [Dehalococcoidia bacterium]
MDESAALTGETSWSRFRVHRALLTSDGVIALSALAVLATGLGLRLAIAWQDLQTLTVKALPDDAFYYFLTADRISNGQGISFDGISPSNGYHPLWLFLLVPLYLLPGRSLPLHLGLTLASVLDVIAGGLIGLAAWRLTGNKVVGLFSLTFYILLPRNILASVDGVENALAAMLLSALLLVVVTAWKEPPERWLRWSIATGVLAGLLVLARLESALVAAAALVALAALRPRPLRWPAPAIVACVAAVVIAPWFIWSSIAVGTPVPVSAEATTWLLREHFDAGNPDAGFSDLVRHGYSETRDVMGRAEDLYLYTRPIALAMLAGVAVVAAHFLLFARGTARRDVIGQVLIAGLPFAAFLAMLLVNSAFRWSVRSWYFAWGIPSLALILGVAFGYLCTLVASVASRARSELAPTAAQFAIYGALVVVMAALFSGHARDSWRIGYFPFQGDNFRAAQYLEAETEPDARVAAFNAGVVGYFSERTVINLDGVVNVDAYHALQDHRLLAYLRSAGVQYVADRDGAWRYLPAYIRPDDWSESLWGEDPNEAMTSIHQLPAPGAFPQMNVWRLLPEDATGP